MERDHARAGLNRDAGLTRSIGDAVVLCPTEATSLTFAAKAVVLHRLTPPGAKLEVWSLPITRPRQLLERLTDDREIENEGHVESKHLADCTAAEEAVRRPQQ